MVIADFRPLKAELDEDRRTLGGGSSPAANCKAGDCLSWAADCPLFLEQGPGDLRRGESLASLTTLKVGGPAAVVARPQSLEELRELIQILDRRGCPRRVIGRGSNVLAADRGYAGVVILLARGLGRITSLPPGNDLGPLAVSRQRGEGGETRLVRVEAGCSLANLLAWTLKKGLGGLEFLVGIPASLGGAVVMNAGAWGESMGNRVHSLTVISGEGSRRVDRADLCFSYRRLGGLAAGEVVGEVTLALSERDPGEIRAMMQRFLKKRQLTQPRRAASAGSFFKNPPGDFAGRLIEQAGLKGLRVGGAEVSSVHANFLVNLAGPGKRGGQAGDLLTLMKLVQAKVELHSGIKLEPEVHFLGFEES